MQRFYSDEELSPRQSLLPSGSLLCHGVVIARTGTQAYHSSELPNTDAGDNYGMVIVERDEDEVFDARSMRSFEGAPVVLNHPSDAVDPSNWKQLSVGHAQNIRREGDTLVADLIIHDRNAIDAIRNRGWRSISCGYDAGYVALSPGRARQTGITGNHIAILSPDQRARCGPVCAIGDTSWSRRETTMDRRWFGKFVLDQEPLPATGRTPAAVSNGEVGGELLMRLPGEITSYYIGSLPNDPNGVGLYRVTSANGLGDVGQTRVGDAARMARETREARERDGRILAGINAKNRAFWGQSER